jgi:hypothetical protein
MPVIITDKQHRALTETFQTPQHTVLHSVHGRVLLQVDDGLQNISAQKGLQSLSHG